MTYSLPVHFCIMNLRLKYRGIIIKCILLWLITASLVTEEGFHSGKIVVKSKNGQFKVTIPYRAQVLTGRLRVNDTSTHFLLEGELKSFVPTRD